MFEPLPRLPTEVALITVSQDDLGGKEKRRDPQSLAGQVAADGGCLDFRWSQGGRDEADSSSEQDTSVRARRRKRGAVKVEQGEEYAEGQSPVKKSQPSSTPAPYSHPESGFRCAPCGFFTEDQAMFLEHISQHRRGGTEGGGQQCLQCGACFTSTSSLSRHCFIAHKVRKGPTDSRPSLSLHPASSPGSSRNHDDKSSLDGSAPASPSSQGMEEEDALSCKVCRKRFEKASDLNTHFRTHGMAFISARNAGKSA